MRMIQIKNDVYNRDSKQVVFALFVVLALFFNSCAAQPTSKSLKVGAARTELYLPILQGKNIGIVANPTSMIHGVHLVDTLLALGIPVKQVFAPEHGFRGEAEAGEHVDGGVDKKSGVKIISLYGDHKKPTKEDLKNLDYLVFDIQDVGARFYTYISTLQYVMEAAAENKLPLLILDRPNPHGNYFDGPVLENSQKSFVGMQQIPVVHGMTVGEYAMMLNGEFWLDDSLQCDVQVIKLLNWDRSKPYQLPIPPSPNLPNNISIQLYPSLCLFEGTVVSLGRGTELPFQCYGFPGNTSGDFEFTPRSIEGKSKHPPFENKLCKGFNLSRAEELKNMNKLEIHWLIDAYSSYPDKEKFFIPFFDKLCGNTTLKKQMSAQWPESKIRLSWVDGLMKFGKIRSKYLMYP